MKKNLPLIIVAFVIVAGASFYGGMKYNAGKSTNVSGQGNFANLANLLPQERQQRFAQMGNNAGRTGTRASGGGFVNGEIISKDNQSITIKSSDGGSKIILFSNATQIIKTISGTTQDLQVGENITTNGTSNSDGSISAQSIQLRPAPPASAPKE